MEDKKLNLNRPILSVRRKSSTIVPNSQKDSSRRKNGSSSVPSLLPSPSSKSEMHSGPLRNPGSVPFVWEQIPGRPKDDRKPEKHHIVPKLPPARILKQELDITTTGPTNDSLDNLKESIDTKKKSRENKKLQITYGPNFLQFNDNDDDGDDDDDYDDDHEHMSYNKVCGLLPHFLKGSSIGLLNPIPGFSVRAKLPQPKAAKVGAHEPKSLVKKQPVLKKKSTENTNQKIPENHSISNFNPTQSSPPVSEGKDEKKGLLSFKELLLNEKETDSQTPAVEKTLYVDTIRKLNENDKGIFGISLDKLNENDKGIFGISPDKLKENDKGIFGISPDKLKQDTTNGVCRVDQKVKVSDLPPLPKSPSDSWLWHTLSSKTASNPKYPSNTTPKLDKNVQSRYPQGLLLPIPEN